MCNLSSSSDIFVWLKEIRTPKRRSYSFSIQCRITIFIRTSYIIVNSIAYKHFAMDYFWPNKLHYTKSFKKRSFVLCVCNKLVRKYEDYIQKSSSEYKIVSYTSACGWWAILYSRCIYLCDYFHKLKWKKAS